MPEQFTARDKKQKFESSRLDKMLKWESADAQSPISWADLNMGVLSMFICAATGAELSLFFGMANENTALYLGVYSNGEKKKMFFYSPEEADEKLANITKALTQTMPF